MVQLDLRGSSPEDQQASVLRRFDDLAPGEALLVVTDAEPQELRSRLDAEHPRGFRFGAEPDPDAWRVRIDRLASTPLPRLVGDARVGAAPGTNGPTAAGAIWKLGMSRRDLDANVIRLLPGTGIGRHAGPDLDVLLLVLDGGGTLTTELDAVALAPYALVWLPRRSVREIRAGDDGLAYFSVHQRREALTLRPPRRPGRPR